MRVLPPQPLNVSPGLLFVQGSRVWGLGLHAGPSIHDPPHAIAQSADTHCTPCTKCMHVLVHELMSHVHSMYYTCMHMHNHYKFTYSHGYACTCTARGSQEVPKAVDSQATTEPTECYIVFHDARDVMFHGELAT